MAADQLGELEAELQSQLEEQRETLATITAALEAEANDELEQMKLQLEAAVQESEAALLQLTRDRLLRQVDALAGAGSGGTAEPHTAAPNTAAAAWQAGQRCVFRSTDGRHYLGTIERVEGDIAHLHFATPTRPHQLAPLQLPAAVLSVPRAPPLALHHLSAGQRVILQPQGSQLWLGGEVSGLDLAEGLVEAVTEEGKRVLMGVASVALSAHVADPWGEESGSEDSSSGEEGSGSEGSDEEDEADDSSEGEDEDGIPYARVAMALSGAAAQAQAAAEAGPQTDTRLFSNWEAHTRGIGSKMLASMGYKGGGLGRDQHGMAAPLEAAQLKKGAGLGAEPGHATREGKKKRKRGGGKKGRQKRAAKAAFDQREAQRDARHQLEQRTGAEGVFAFINSMIGDASEAAAVQRASAGGGESSVSGAAGGKQAHLFAATVPKAGPAAAAATKPPDRRALAGQQEQLAQLRQKVSRLKDMAKRNAKDKVMLPQIQRALGEAQKQLDAAEQAHNRTQQSIQQKEKEKRWTKF